MKTCRALWKAITTHNQQDAAHTLDVIRVGDPEGPQLGIKDPQLLEWAIQHERVIVTRDANSLIGEHDRLVASGRGTPGPFVTRAGFTIPEVVAELVLYTYALTAEECASTCRYIPER
jgi:hypothetical protein